MTGKRAYGTEHLYHIIKYLKSNCTPRFKVFLIKAKYSDCFESNVNNQVKIEKITNYRDIRSDVEPKNPWNLSGKGQYWTRTRLRAGR